jgi:hypothetical protein
MRGVTVKSKKRYTVSDGKIVLTFETADEGGYVITSPFDPDLITQAETIEEAFANAADAAKALRRSGLRRPKRAGNRTHSLAEFVGMFKDDPLSHEWKKAMADYRRTIDRTSSTPTC